jgi:hypothetical protein
MNLKAEYEQDFHQWINHHITLLKERRFNEIDVEHLIEELEDMGKSNLRELRSRLIVLIAHLLKWEHQLKLLQNKWDSYTGKSWKGTIIVQRSGIIDLLQENPSLKRFLLDAINESYPTALKSAIAETGLPKSAFSNECSYTIEQLLDEDFYPESKESDSQNNVDTVRT